MLAWVVGESSIGSPNDMFDLNNSSSDDDEEEEEKDQHPAPAASSADPRATAAAPAASTASPAPPTAEPVLSEGPQSSAEPTPAAPAWWKAGFDEQLAEVLFIHDQKYGTIQHWVFQTEEMRQRFPTITQRQWFVALDFAGCAWRSPSSALRVHHALLKRKRVRVSLPADQPEQRRSTRRKPTVLGGGGSCSAGAWRGIVTDHMGTLLSGDEDDAA